MTIESKQEIKSPSLSLEQQVFLLRADNFIAELGHRVSSIRCPSEQTETTLHNGTKTTKISDKISKTLIVDTVVSETECPTVTELRTDIMGSQKGKNRWQSVINLNLNLAIVSLSGAGLCAEQIYYAVSKGSNFEAIGFGAGLVAFLAACYQSGKTYLQKG